MKSISTLFRQLSLIVVIISAFSLSAWGEEKIINNIFSSTTMQASVSSYTDTWNNISGTELKLVNFNNNQKGWTYVKCGRNNNTSIGTITTTSPLTEKITKVVVTIDAVTTANVNSTYLEVASDASFTQNLQKINVNIAKGDLTYEIPTPTSNCYYRLTYDCASGSSNGLVTISKVNFYYNTGESDGGDPETPCTTPEISFTETTVTKTNGDDPFTNTLTTNSSGEVTYTSSATNVAIVDNKGQVTIKGVGTTTITATVAADGTYCEATAEYTLTVEGRTFNITWMNGTETPQTTTYKEGETLKFPTDPTPSTACQSAGWEFAGWSTTAIDSDTKTANLITNSYTPTKNTDLYAVYQLKTTTSEGEEAWALTDIANISATDEVVITMKKSDGKIYALTNDKGTSNPPTPTSITITNNKITSTIDDSIKWNISNSNGNLTIYHNGTTATWLYCTNANNGVRVGNNTAKTFTIDGNYLKHTETSRYVGIYNTQDWRCYTDTTGNIANQTLGFYKKFGGTQTTITYNSNPDCETPIAQIPTFTPEEGKVADNKFTEPFSLTISSETENATIYYSFDGEIFNKYTEPITISNTTTTIYAYAEAEGYNKSNTTEITYTFLKTYTVNWYNGELVLTEEYTENTALNLPEPQSSCSDVYTNFTGWTTNASGYKGVINSNEPQYVSNETIVTSNMDLYAVFNNATTTISLVTVASTLDVGDKIVIAAKEYDFALSTTQKDNNRGQAAITKSDNTITFGNDVQILTLEQGKVDNTFAFNTGSGYLYAASSSKNYLRTETSLSTNSSWTIEIDSVATIKAQGTNTRNLMRYNSNNNLFSCYSSGQNDIVIYKVEGELASGWTICGEATDIIVENNQTVTIKNTANVNTLTIKSNLDEAGQVAVTSGSLTAQKVVVEKTIDDSRWFFFSLPFDCKISDIVATDANGKELEYAKDATSGDYVINQYNQTRADGKEKAWEELLGTEHKLNANQGYIIGHFGKGDVTVKFHSTEAQTISAPADKTLDYTDTWFVDGENSSKGFNLIGMPYYQNINSTISCGDVYIYSTIPNEDGKTYTQQKYTGNNVAPFTSFFVQVAENTAPTFTIETQSAAPMLRAKDVVAKATITLADANGGADETTVINNPTKTTDYEIGHDLVKWIGYAEIPQIYSIQGEDILAFNSLAMNNETIIPLGVYAHADGDYTFSLSDKSMGNLEGWELYDSESGKAVALTDESLTVTLSKGTHEGRFSIRMEQGTTTDCECDMSNIVTYMNNGTFYIENMPAKAMVYIYDAVGRMIYATETTDTSFDYTFALRGVYNVVVSTEYNSIAYKTIY